MRRIVIALMGTVSGVALLFSYHTSTRSAGSASPQSAAPASEPSPAASSPSSADGSGSTPSSSSSGSSSSSSGSSAGSGGSSSGTYTGSEADTRWGVVQVQIEVRNGTITKSTAVEYPQNNPRDVEINDYALPQLAQEVLQQQSANIDAVSGATVTSDGYVQSLQSAIDQAHL